MLCLADGRDSIPIHDLTRTNISLQTASLFSGESSLFSRHNRVGIAVIVFFASNRRKATFPWYRRPEKRLLEEKVDPDDWKTIRATKQRTLVTRHVALVTEQFAFAIAQQLWLQNRGYGHGTARHGFRTTTFRPSCAHKALSWSIWDPFAPPPELHAHPEFRLIRFAAKDRHGNARGRKATRIQIHRIMSERLIGVSSPFSEGIVHGVWSSGSGVSSAYGTLT